MSFSGTIHVNGKSGDMGSLDDLVKYVQLYVRRPIALSGVILPFVPLYLLAFYMWIFFFGVESYEAGLISVFVVIFLHVLSLLCCYWSVHVLAFLNCSRVKKPGPGVLAKVVPTANNGSTQMVQMRSTEMGDGETQYYFHFQKTKYIWDEDKATFRTVQFPVHLLLSRYAKSRGHETQSALDIALKTYGDNEMEMVVPEFYQLFIERATAPFFVFQILSVALWCLDEYWYYSLLTLVMLVAFECTLVQQQVSNMSEIRKMGNKPYLVYVMRNNKWRQIISDQLVPGDLVSIVRSRDESIVPCDLVLLRGRCIIDESMLTGESVPQMKEPLESVNNLNTNLDDEGPGKLFVLFGGTKVVQHTSPTKDGLRAPDGGCIGFVMRTGFNTSQGKLLRTILFGVKRVTENNFETFAFIIFLMIFAIAAASYVWIRGIEDPERSRYKLFLECTLILTSIIPPDLPIELSLAVNTSLLQLTKLFIFCTEPFRIPFAGKVQICCFDKTGTLTSDNLMVEGVTGLQSDDTITPMSLLMNEQTIQVLACCHSLVLLDDGLVGDPLEKAILNTVKWKLTKTDSVIPQEGNHRPIRIFQRFYFSSALKRMSVLAGSLDPLRNGVRYIGAVKGAPETIMKMLKKVPENYEKIYLKHTRRGARVLALGIKDFGYLEQPEARLIKREDVECGLDFAGFVTVSCPIKPDSKASIKELLQASQRVVMITGDFPLTACQVAKNLHFVRKPVLVLTPPKYNAKCYFNGDLIRSEWNWKSTDGTSVVIHELKPIIKLKANYDLCITGEGLQHLMDWNELELIPYVAVFARFAPKQKEFVINTLKQFGFYVLMCGDGTNDVGALKHADVGVSLLSHGSIATKSKKHDDALNEINQAPVNRQRPTHGPGISPNAANILKKQNHLNNLENSLREMEEPTVVKLGDASIAAPFTSKTSSISCVNHIIKQGRCTLVTTLQMFKILALNALISAYCQSVLYIGGVKFSDTQATLQGILIAACFLCITRSKPLKTLSKIAPLPNIFNAYSVSTILLQFIIHFSSLYYLTLEASARSPPREGKIKLDVDMDLEERQKFTPNLLNSTVYIICLSLQVSTFAVNYKGHPFMESLRENRMLLSSILVSAALVVALSLGISPELSYGLEIIEFPSDFRSILIIVLVLDTVLAYAADRLCSFWFGETRQKSKALNY